MSLTLSLNLFLYQAENKQVSEESARLVALEQQKRETLSRKFEVIIADIKIKLDADLVLKRTLALETKKSEQLIQSQIDEIEVLNETINRSDFEHREEVAAITKRLVEFIEQYELREVHFASVNQTRSLAYQFTAAKVIAQSDSNENLTQANDIPSTRAGQSEALNSVGLKRKEMVPFVEFPNSAEIARHEHIERGLKEQLLVYVEKFNKVELTLQKSDTLFKTLRNEMQRTNLKTLALERENTDMKLRFETLSSSMTALADDVIFIPLSLI
jgi:Myosin-like coiled-coil protein